MSTVLQLQKLTPTGNRDQVHILLSSTYSGVCPTTVTTDEGQHFEME